MTETPKKCVTCHYWQMTGDHPVGDCHRRSPTRNLQGDKCCWVPTGVLDWCGEWEIASTEELKLRKSIFLKEKK